MDHPTPVAPKKRLNGKKSTSATGHVDHIIVVQGSNGILTPKNNPDDEGSRNCLLNGNVNCGMNGIKNSLKIQLPIIKDDGDEDATDNSTDAGEPLIEIERPHSLNKNGYQPVITNMVTNRDVNDLSPIYENSSDACSSHDDLCEIIDGQITQKACKLLIDESSTPNSLSQTQSETSLEMGLLSDHSAKNSAKRTKKRVNILSESSEETEAVVESALYPQKCSSDGSNSPDKSMSTVSADGYLTMTGTIKRGKKKGQNIDVKLNISREELEVLEAAIVAKETNKWNILLKCTPANGLHIFLFSLLCSPVILLISVLYSFYIGTITWYNIFSFINEETTLLKKILLSPLIVILFPFLIISFTFSLGCYAAVAQLTFNANTWWKEVCDLEKGFFGWLCSLIRLPDCSPYEVIILTELKVAKEIK